MLICTIILQIIAKKIAGTENITVHMNPGIQIVVVHQVTGVYLCKCNFDFTKKIDFFSSLNEKIKIFLIYSDDDSSYYRPRRKADYRDFKSSRHNRTSKKSYANHSTHHNNTRDYYGHGRDERRYDR